MNVVRGIIGWLMPLAILGAGAAVFMMLGRQPVPELKEPDKPEALKVLAVEAVLEAGVIAIELDGVVVPLREVTLAAEVPGKVLSKSEACRAGRSVTKGTLLFEIDPRDYEFEITRLELEAAQAEFAIDEVDEEAVQNATAMDLATQQLELAGREVRRLYWLRANRIVTEAEHYRAIR